MSLATVLAFGLLLGMQHATEADHLAAVASLASREGTLAAGMAHGIAWGMGHTLMLLIVAGALGFLGWAISPPVADSLERVVGAMLIALGLGVVRRLWREGRQFHGHTPHRLAGHARSHELPWRSIAVGLVHGLAGSAALTLVASQSFSSPAGMLVYITVFGLGSVFGMVLLSGALAIPLRLTARHLRGMDRILNGGVALFSLAWGGRLLFALGR
jgi:hypothetical protein